MSSTRTSTAKYTITVTEREFKIALSSKTAKKGLVRLVVRNAGKYAHALSIKGAGVSKRTPLIKPGKSAVLLVTLRSGRYALWCPVPGHAAQGMKATLSLAGATGDDVDDDDHHRHQRHDDRAAAVSAAGLLGVAARA